MVSEHTPPVLVVQRPAPPVLGILAGFLQVSRDPGVFWIDAHNTQATTPSGHLGDMPWP